MELYDIWLRLNQTVHQQFKIKAKNNGFVVTLYVNDNVHCYISLIDEQKKEVTFTNTSIRSVEHDNDDYIYQKIMATLQVPKL
jgi:hypothetical protein